MHSSRPILVPVIAAILASGFDVRSAFADDVNSLLEVLEENVVSGASRATQRASEAPAVSSTIDGEQLRRFGIHRLDEALNFLSLGAFAHDRMSTAEAGARGLALTRDRNNHMLVVLDGMVVNEQGGGAVNLHDIPIDVVDHIEVILGPGSVLYGAQAMLGVINVVTKSARDNDGVHLRMLFGASPPIDANGSIGSPTLDNMGHDNHYALSLGRTLQLFGRPLQLVALVDYSDFKGPAIEFSKQPIPLQPNGAPAFNPGPHGVPGYWGGPVNEQWFRKTAGAYTRVEVGELTWATRATTTRLAMPQMDLFENRVGGAYDDPHNYNSYALMLSDLKIQHRFSDRITGMARAYFGYSRTMFSRFLLTHDDRVAGVPLGIIDPEQCPIGLLGPCRKESWFVSRWIGIEPQINYDWLNNGVYTTMIGVDARLRTAAYEYVSFDDETGQSYGSDPALTRWHGGGNKQLDEQALGPYIQQMLKPSKLVAFNAGLRFDYDSRIASKDRALSPRLAAIVTPSDHLSLKAIYSTAFRAPSFVELYSVSGRLLPNPEGLQPETVSSYEAVADLHFGVNTFSLSGFYTKWQNLIELQIVKARAPSVSHYANVANVRNLGTNLSYETSLFDRHVRTGINLTVASSERELTPAEKARDQAYGVGDTVPMTVAPHVYGNARVSYGFADQANTAVSFVGGFMGPRIADQAYYGGDPSNLLPRPEAPSQLEVRGVWTGDFPGLRGVSYTMGANYAFARFQPYVVGPNQGLPLYLATTPVQPALALVNRLTIFFGMEFSVDGEATAKTAYGTANR